MPDFLFLMESRLSPEQISVVQRMQSAAVDQTVNVFLVGGALRDVLCGQPIRDLDFAVEGNPLKMVRALEKAGSVDVHDVDEVRKIAQMTFPGDIRVEVSQCRTERYGKAGAEPEFALSAIYDDLRRRDFSMNAIGLSLNPASRGLVLDPTNGAGDIERREIRSLHNYTFVDDPARMLRLVRFRARYGFSVDPKTEQQYTSARERGLLEYALASRLLHELREITRDPSPSEVLKALDKEGMTAAWHPRLTGQRLNLPLLAKVEKTGRWLEEQGLKPNLYGPLVFFLTQKLSAADKTAFCRRMQMKRTDSDPWMRLEEEGKKLVRLLGSKEANTPSKAFLVLSRQRPELILFVLLHFPQKKVQDKLKNYLSRHRPLRDKLPEKDLEALGIPRESPRFGRILEAFFTALVDGKVKSRTDQARFLKKLAGDVK